MLACHRDSVRMRHLPDDDLVQLRHRSPSGCGWGDHYAASALRALDGAHPNADRRATARMPVPLASSRRTVVSTSVTLATPHRPRTGRNAHFLSAICCRQSIYSRLAGYEDTKRRGATGRGPDISHARLRGARESSVALTSTLHWFETDVLAEERNYQGLAQVNADLVQHAAARSLSRRVVLDIDSSKARSTARRAVRLQRSFRSPCAITRSSSFNPRGDCLAAKLRPATSTAPRDGTKSAAHR